MSWSYEAYEFFVLRQHIRQTRLSGLKSEAVVEVL